MTEKCGKNLNTEEERDNKIADNFQVTFRVWIWLENINPLLQNSCISCCFILDSKG